MTDWTSEIKWATKALGIRQHVPVADNPTCGNARFVNENCDNVNLDADGFCQTCDRHHWNVAFGKVYKCWTPRKDQGCESFGDANASDLFGGDLTFAGTGVTGTNNIPDTGPVTSDDVLEAFLMDLEEDTLGLKVAQLKARYGIK
jgi:hypothetical protein